MIINLNGTLNDNSDIIASDGSMIFSYDEILSLPNGQRYPAKIEKYDCTHHTLTVTTDCGIIANITLA